MAFVDSPLLNEIKTGIRLRPTKTIDKSAPVILVDGEKYNRIDRGSCPPPAPPLNLAPPAPPAPRCASASPTPSSLHSRKNSDADRAQLLTSIRGGVRLKRTETRDASAPILDTSQVTSFRSDPPHTNGFERRDSPPTGHRQVGDRPPSSSPSPSSYRSAHSVLPTPSPEREIAQQHSHTNGYARPPSPEPEPSPQKPQADFAFREDDLYVTGEKLQREIPAGKAALARAMFDSTDQTSPPSPLNEAQRKYSLNSYLRPDTRPAGAPPDASFDEAALKVTSDTLKREIPAGTAASKISRFANGEIGQTNSLPRIRFKPGQLRTPFHESDTNLAKEEPSSGYGTLPRTKSPSAQFLAQQQRAARAPTMEEERSRPPPARSASQQSTPQFARNLFDSRPSPSPPPPSQYQAPPRRLLDSPMHQKQTAAEPQRADVRPPPPQRSASVAQFQFSREDPTKQTVEIRTPVPTSSGPSRKPYEPVYADAYDRAAAPWKAPTRAALVTPQMALGTTTQRSAPRQQPPQHQQQVQQQQQHTYTASPACPVSPAASSQVPARTPVATVVPGPNIRAAEWVAVPSATTPTTTASPLVYTVQNGQPRLARPAQVSQTSPRSRSTSRPSWRDQQSIPASYTYSPAPSSSYTYNQPPQPVATGVTASNYTPFNFQNTVRQPRISNVRSNSEMSRPMIVRTDLIPSSPLHSVEPSPVSPLRPLEVRDAHTSPMSGQNVARNPLAQNGSHQHGHSNRQTDRRPSTTTTGTINMRAPNGARASSPESSMSSSQQSPSSLSPGSTSPPPLRHQHHHVQHHDDGQHQKRAQQLPPPLHLQSQQYQHHHHQQQPEMPRPFFGNYSPHLSTPPATPTSRQADALRAAVLDAARSKSNTPQRMIAVPISASWQNGNAHHRVISPQDLCHMSPGAMREQFRFNIDLSNDGTPITISRR